MDQPLYYEPSGPVAFSAYVYGSGKSKLELFLDNKRIQKDRLELAGAAIQLIPVTEISPGTHMLKATLDNDPLESTRERTVIYGAHLPDLTISHSGSEARRAGPPRQRRRKERRQEHGRSKPDRLV